MNYKITFVLTALLITSALIVLGCTRSIASRQNVEPRIAANNNLDNKKPDSKNAEYNGEKIVKTEAEWRKQLTKEEFYVLRKRNGTRLYGRIHRQSRTRRLRLRGVRFEVIQFRREV